GCIVSYEIRLSIVATPNPPDYTDATIRGCTSTMFRGTDFFTSPTQTTPINYTPFYDQFLLLPEMNNVPTAMYNPQPIPACTAGQYLFFYSNYVRCAQLVCPNGLNPTGVYQVNGDMTCM